jgi:hypothetical protein
MSIVPNRIVIYTKDVANMTGMSDKASRKLLCSIRKKLNKPKGSFVTLQDFSSCTGINEEVIKPFLV